MRTFFFILLLPLSAIAQNMIDKQNYEQIYISKIQEKLNNVNFDFRLIDQFASPFSLEDFTNGSKIIIASFNPDCEPKTVKDYLKQSLKKEKIKKILYLNSQISPNREKIIAQFPNQSILLDEYQQVGKFLELKKAGDYIVYDFKKNKIIKVVNSPFDSCPIHFHAYDERKLQAEVLPAFQRSCLSCHSRMESFEYYSHLSSIQQWRQMMLKTIQIKRMPPGADPYYSPLISNHTHDDMVKVVKWLEAGAPFTSEDQTFFAKMLKEDSEKISIASAEFVKKRILLINFPDEVVEAEGSDFYKHYRTTTPTSEDYFFSDFSVNINEKVAHHTALHFSPKPFPDVDRKGNPVQVSKDNMVLYGNNKIPIMGTINGKKIDGYKFQDPNIIHVARRQGLQISPAGTTYFIPKGSYLNFEIHYNPNGSREISPVKMYIAPLRSEQQGNVIKRISMTPLDKEVVVKKNEAKSLVTLDYVSETNMLLKGFGMHMHYRGKYGKVFIQRPGEKELVLAIAFPTYQYKNQVTSVFRDGIKIPKGSLMRTEIMYNNSTSNSTNPDSLVDVKIGTSVTRDENYLPRFLYVEEND